MFKKIIDDINNYVETVDKKEEEKKISLNDIPLFNQHAIKEKLTQIDELDDRELYDILKSYYSEILKDIFKNQELNKLNLFTNTRFLTVFIQVINSVKITYDDIIYCNKISYDYLTYNKDSDEYIKSLFLSLSKTVNKSIIPSLVGLGLSENFSSFLALSRYSSTKESVNIRRVNYLLISSSPNQMTEQMIVYIYEKLFDNFTILFKETMFDPYTDEELNNISAGAKEIYSNISLALIDLLNLMPDKDIRKVLKSYADDYNVSKDIKIRFSIKSLAVSDYSRILNVVNDLEFTELVIVP